MTLGNTWQMTQIGPCLFHLVVPRGTKESLHALASSHLELIARMSDAHEQRQALDIALDRSHFIQKTTQEKYQENTERLIQNTRDFSRMFELSLIPSFRSRLDGQIVRGNPAFLRLLGFQSLEEINRAGGARSRYLSPSERGAFVRKVMRAPVSSFETRLLHKSGRPIDVILSAYLVKGSHGNPCFLEGSIFDNSSQIHAMETIRRAKAAAERERKLFMSGPVVVFTWINEEQWPVSYASPNVEELFGYSAAELTCGDVVYAELIPEQDMGRVRREVQAALDNSVQSFTHAPYRIRRKDGRFIWVDDHTTLVRDESGRVTHFLGYVIDASKRVEAEESRREMERQFLHAQKMESLGILAGGIAHDFNNILMAILGNADLASQQLSAISPARPMLEEITHAARRAADLSQQMLAYSGKGRFIVESIHVDELLQEMAHLLEVTIPKNVMLKFDFPSHLPSFEGDPTQIRQVVMNLLTNAAEAIGSRDGVVTLSAGTRHCDRDYLEGLRHFGHDRSWDPVPEGDYIFLKVTDNGCGMSRETLDKLFDPFFTTKFTGRGLGMSAVLGIVHGHSGAIHVDSTAGEGTTFTILFPVTSAQRTSVGTGHNAAAAQAMAATPLEGTVLVVDDEESVRTVACRMLHHMGFKTLVACDGREALRQFRRHGEQITCVLLDLTMPQMNGEQTFLEMRRLKPDVKVVLCSGYNEQDATQQLAGKGLASFVQKPFSLEVLESAMRGLLGQELEF